MFQDFLLKKMLRTQGVPPEQVEVFVAMIKKNPGLFQKIAEEVKVKIDAGRDHKSAAMEVMKKYEEDLKKLKG